MGFILSKFKNNNNNFSKKKDLYTPLFIEEINNINNKLNIIENKIYILENNTQENIKLLSQDIHHINSQINNKHEQNNNNNNN